MKQKIKISFIALAIIISTAVLFYSCKKNTELVPNIETSTVAEKQKAVNAFTEKLQLAGNNNAVNFKVNKIGRAYYADLNGNRVTGPFTETISCPATGESEFESEFYNIRRSYECGQGYYYTISHKVRSEFNLLTGIGNQINTFSFGRIKLRGAGNSTIYQTPFASRYKINNITDNGVVAQNSYGADLHEFVFSYKTEYFDASIIDFTINVEPMVYIYTSCSSYPAIQIPYQTGVYANVTTNNAFPCLRNDPMYTTGYYAGYTNPNDIIVAPVGYASLASVAPAGFVYPTKQRLHYKGTDGFWHAFWFYKDFLPSVKLDDWDYFAAWSIDLVKMRNPQNGGFLPIGDVEIRYKNIYNGCTGPVTYTTWYFD